MRVRDNEQMKAILQFINDTYFKEGYVPTYREIAEEFGISTSSAYRNVKFLEEKGLLTTTAKGNTVTTTRMKKLDRSTIQLEVIGAIACGTPIFAEENIESYLTISASFLGTGEYFALRAKGNSMINAGINDGDYVIIRKQNYADEGQIVVALVGDEATLKRYYLDRENKRVRLHPENNRMKDMFYDEIAIQGVAVKVIKDLED